MTKGAVAFIDILGFKGIWHSMNPQDIIKLFDGVKPRVQQTYMENLQGQKLPFQSAEPQITILSDTIVITIESNNPLCLAILASVIFDLFDYFSERRLFFRGAVSYGNYIQYGNTFIGPTIDDVATWYEAANWIGVISTPKTSYQIDSFSALEAIIKTSPHIKNIPCYFKYDVPSRDNRINFPLNCLNWPGYRECRYTSVPEGICATQKEMEKLFAAQEPFDNSVLVKYENTLRFVNYCFEKLNPK